MKDAGMRIRVEPELRERFVNICREKDVPAAQVLRSFMRDYIKTNEQIAQAVQPKQPMLKKPATAKAVR